MKLIIDIPNEGYDWIKNGFLDNEDEKFLIKAVKNGTPYDERLQGEWIRGMYNECPNDAYCKCNKCNYIDYSCRFYNFCPNCGADMRKGGAE